MVQEEIIAAEDHEKISAAATSIKKAEIVLQIVSRALKAGCTDSFYNMIQIMKYFGNIDTKSLSATIERKLTGLEGKESMIKFNCKLILCTPYKLNQFGGRYTYVHAYLIVATCAI